MLVTIRRYLIRLLKPVSGLAGHIYIAPKKRMIKTTGSNFYLVNGIGSGSV